MSQVAHKRFPPLATNCGPLGNVGPGAAAPLAPPFIQACIQLCWIHQILQLNALAT